jgi:hypothetical protein
MRPLRSESDYTITITVEAKLYEAFKDRVASDLGGMPRGTWTKLCTALFAEAIKTYDPKILDKIR